MLTSRRLPSSLFRLNSKILVLLLALIAVSMLPTGLMAQEQDESEARGIPFHPRNVVSIFPMAGLEPGLRLGYERMLNGEFGIKVIGMVIYGEQRPLASGSNFSGYEIMVQPRLYLNREPVAPEGIYMGFYASARGLNWLDRTPHSASTQRLGVMIGGQYLIGGRFSIEGQFGGGINFCQGDYWSVNGLVLLPYRPGIRPMGNFSVGIGL